MPDCDLADIDNTSSISHILYVAQDIDAISYIEDKLRVVRDKPTFLLSRGFLSMHLYADKSEVLQGFCASKEEYEALQKKYSMLDKADNGGTETKSTGNIFGADMDISSAFDDIQTVCFPNMDMQEEPEDDRTVGERIAEGTFSVEDEEEGWGDDDFIEEEDVNVPAPASHINESDGDFDFDDEDWSDEEYIEEEDKPVPPVSSVSVEDDDEDFYGDSFDEEPETSEEDEKYLREYNERRQRNATQEGVMTINIEDDEDEDWGDEAFYDDESNEAESHSVSIEDDEDEWEDGEEGSFDDTDDAQGGWLNDDTGTHSVRNRQRKHITSHKNEGWGATTEVGVSADDGAGYTEPKSLDEDDKIANLIMGAADKLTKTPKKAKRGFNKVIKHVVVKEDEVIDE